MSKDDSLEIFLAAPPGLEDVLVAEARERGFRAPKALPGGVRIEGRWPDVWRANLELRGATRVLARIGAFRVSHLAQLDKLARQFPWAETLRPDVPLRVETTCKASRIYHAGAATERIARAIAEELGAPIAATAEEAVITVKTRLFKDVCTLSLDSSGPSLHRRGHKEEVNKAPLRETLAALFLRQCGFDGVEPVVDPMCGSGTFVIEAAEIAAGLRPGRSRAFVFEQLATFDAAAYAALRDRLLTPRAFPSDAPRFFGSDRDAGAIRMSTANAERAGVAPLTAFRAAPVSDAHPPEGPPGLVMINPPYGERIGDRKALTGLYRSLGQILSKRFQGWRVGLLATDPALAQATGLPLEPAGPPVPHGGLRVTLYRSPPLA